MLGAVLFALGLFAHPVSRASAGGFLKEQGGRIAKPWKDLHDVRPGNLTRANEIRVLRGLLETMYPRTDGSPTRDKNLVELDKLIRCVEWANCTNQERVVVGASMHFRGGDLGSTAGEDVW